MEVEQASSSGSGLGSNNHHELDYDFTKLRKLFPPNPPLQEADSESQTPPCAKHQGNMGCADWTGFISKASSNPFASGGCADIYHGRWTVIPDGVGVLPKVVVKDVKMLAQEYGNERIREKKSVRIRREVMVWQRVRHRNVLPFVGIVNFPRRLTSLVFLYMDQGDVHTYLQTHPRTNRLSLLIGITAGLTFLHSFAPPIIHGDMKPVNILIDVSGQPRIADFGLSKLKGEITSFSTMGGGGRGERTKAPGTTRYMAPELFGTQLSVTLESDVWAWGMSALEILTGKPPYYTLREATVMWTLVGQQKLPDRPSPSLIPDRLWMIIMRCWELNPLLRPGMSQVEKELREYERSLPDTLEGKRLFEVALEEEPSSSEDENEDESEIGPYTPPGSGSGSNTISPGSTNLTGTDLSSFSYSSSSGSGSGFFDISRQFDWIAFRRALPAIPPSPSPDGASHYNPLNPTPPPSSSPDPNSWTPNSGATAMQELATFDLTSLGLPAHLPNWTGYLKRDEYPFFGGGGIYVWEAKWVGLPEGLKRVLKLSEGGDATPNSNANGSGGVGDGDGDGSPPKVVIKTWHESVWGDLNARALPHPVAPAPAPAQGWSGIGRDRLRNRSGPRSNQNSPSKRGSATDDSHGYGKGQRNGNRNAKKPWFDYGAVGVHHRASPEPDIGHGMEMEVDIGMQTEGSRQASGSGMEVGESESELDTDVDGTPRRLNPNSNSSRPSSPTGSERGKGRRKVRWRSFDRSSSSSTPTAVVITTAVGTGLMNPPDSPHRPRRQSTTNPPDSPSRPRRQSISTWTGTGTGTDTSIMAPPDSPHRNSPHRRSIMTRRLPRPPAQTRRRLAVPPSSHPPAATQHKLALHELRVWSQLRHRNILELVGVVLSESGSPTTDGEEGERGLGRLAMVEGVSPWMKNGNAADYFGEESNRFKSKRRFFLELAQGIRYLHEFNPPIVHAHIEPANILVDEYGSPKIIDFKQALQRNNKGVFEGPDATRTDERGVVMWAAPEVLSGMNADISPAYDAYSYAMTCLSLTTGKLPFDFDRGIAGLLVHIVTENGRPRNPFLSTLHDTPMVETLRLWNEYAAIEPSKRDDRKEVMRRVEAAWKKQDAEKEIWKLWNDCWKRVSPAGNDSGNNGGGWDRKTLDAAAAGTPAKSGSRWESSDGRGQSDAMDEDVDNFPVMGERPDMGEVVRRMVEIVALDPEA